MLFCRYWEAYGGFGALVKSPYLHAAVLLLCITFSMWTQSGWWDLSISILTSLISFTLAGYAMTMAFGDKRFFKIMSEDIGDGRPPPFQVINSTFFHFILVQIFALLMAIVAKARPISSLPDEYIQEFCNVFPVYETLRPILGQIFWFGGFFMFLYSLTLALAAAAVIYKMFDWYADYTNQ